MTQAEPRLTEPAFSALNKLKVAFIEKLAEAAKHIAKDEDRDEVTPDDVYGALDVVLNSQWPPTGAEPGQGT